MVWNPPANAEMPETQFRPLLGEDPLWSKKWQPTQQILARTIPWTEESGGLQPREQQELTGD